MSSSSVDCFLECLVNLKSLEELNLSYYFRPLFMYRGIDLSGVTFVHLMSTIGSLPLKRLYVDDVK